MEDVTLPNPEDINHNEWCVVLAGGNVIAGFESFEQAIGYAESSWEANVPENYSCGDEVGDGSPVLSISEVTRISDWGNGTIG
jgi:hypothetical protein